GTLEGLDRTVDRYCRDYPSTAPDVLAVRVRRRLRDVHRLLGGKLTPTQHRHLVVPGGWLATLLACLQFDLGDREAAERTRDAAFQLAKEGEHQELIAWTFELLAWFALVDRRYQDTVDYARAGLGGWCFSRGRVVAGESGLGGHHIDVILDAGGGG